MGTDGFEFVEYAAPDPAALGTLFEHMGFARVARHRSKDVSLYRQGDVNFIVNAEKDSFAQGFARVHGPSICAIALPGEELGRGLQARSVARRLGRRGQGRADGAQHPGHQGHRRFADLPGRPLRRARHDLRRRFRVPARRRAQSHGRRPHLHRSPDAQRPSRPHGRVGRFLRAALQFPRDPLLRHRGQAHRAEEPRR